MRGAQRRSLALIAVVQESRQTDALGLGTPVRKRRQRRNDKERASDACTRDVESMMKECVQ